MDRLAFYRNAPEKSPQDTTSDDGGKLLTAAVIYLLWKEKADFRLIAALAYILL